MALLSLSPNVLEWAALKHGKSLNEVAHDLAAPSKIDRFLEGKLTSTQAIKLAGLARIPFGFLLLNEPPVIAAPTLPDLRQVPGPETLDANFWGTVADVKRKQEWFSEYLQEVGASTLPFVGKFHSQTGPEVERQITKELSAAVAAPINVRREFATADGFYSYLVDRLETLGILVFKNGVLKSNTHAPLSVSQFRGFALVDAYAPAIFINGRDWPSAWIFTLIHEAAHIWFGSSGVSDISASNRPNSQGIEAACNRIAANVLTPEEDFRQQWQLHDSSHLAMLSRTFRVSQLVIARRALDLGLVDLQFYLAAVEAAKRATEDGGGGGNGLANIKIRNSRRLVRTVVAEALRGNLLLREASDLIHASPDSIMKLSKEL